MLPELQPGYLISVIFCVIAFVFISIQVFRNPNRLRLFVLFYSIITLPANIINVLTVHQVLPPVANVLSFTTSTLIKVIAHFLMIASVGYRLHIDDGIWKHPLILFGFFFLTCTVVAIILETIAVCTHERYTGYKPLFYEFVIGLISAILSDVCAFIFTFLPLLYRKKERRSHEGYSRTTALGIWFFSTQCTCYILQVSCYIWFLATYNWDNFSILLAIDYAIRFIQNLLYTCPPPSILIDFLTIELADPSIGLSTRQSKKNKKKKVKSELVMSSERYNQKTHVEYEPNMFREDVEHRPSIYDTSKFESSVTIIPKP
ncbi:hypothetical protein CU097_007049 [Rhizopus azygosporus]|uniref:Integral membrane protein n=2 Tax=Rhizopus TaxID=4842 RepID=A0A367KDU9_RHIAZ|nr:hypothetical protein BCV71DRAFT_224409 [Rhizopus microsporus]RCI00280.1 hypothetical protein CU097_007049 [Rhizopus azygosporus]